MANIKSEINWCCKVFWEVVQSFMHGRIGGESHRMLGWAINDSFSVPHLTLCCDNCPYVFIFKLSNYRTYNGLNTIGYFGSVRFVKVNFVRHKRGVAS